MRLNLNPETCKGQRVQEFAETDYFDRVKRKDEHVPCKLCYTCLPTAWFPSVSSCCYVRIVKGLDLDEHWGDDRTGK